MMNDTLGLHEKPVTKVAECPVCHAEMPVHFGYVTWCDHCGWNLQPSAPAQPNGLLESLYSTIGRRLNQKLFRDLAGAKLLKPGWTLSKVLAFSLASLVHGVTLACFLVGLWLVVSGWPNPISVVLGAISLMLTLILRPRLTSLPEGIVSASEVPTLHRIVQTVAEVLQAGNVGIVAIDWRFNASFRRVGWRRTRAIGLGLPLLSVLNGGEKVAIIAHELAHDVNGDPVRGFYVGSAIDSLSTWHTLVHPVSVPRVAVSQHDLDQLDRELVALRGKIQDKLIDLYRASLC